MGPCFKISPPATILKTWNIFSGVYYSPKFTNYISRTAIFISNQGVSSPWVEQHFLFEDVLRAGTRRQKRHVNWTYVCIVVRSKSFSAPYLSAASKNLSLHCIDVKLVDPDSRYGGLAANAALPVAMQTFVKKLQSFEVYCLHLEIRHHLEYTRIIERINVHYV